jgi:ribosome-binding protein aMBF1 (putative translation factor)
MDNIMTDLPHQDWETRVLRRKETQEEKKKTGKITTVRRGQDNKQTNTVLNKSVLNDFDPEKIIAPVTATHELKLALQKARQDKGMTQDTLNRMCNFPKGTITGYENGTATINADHLNKLNAILGVKLPRPVKK